MYKRQEFILFKKARYRVAQRVRLFIKGVKNAVFETLFIDSFRVKMQKFLHFCTKLSIFETRGVSNCWSKAGASTKLRHQDPRSNFNRIFRLFFSKKSAAKGVDF